MNQKIIDKIQRLLRLAQSDNANEAASAAAAAQRLMDQHRLSAAMVEEEEPETIGQASYEEEGAKVVKWHGYLLYHLCKANGCYHFYSKQHHTRTIRYTIFGKATNIAVVRYLHGYLVAEIDRLSKIEARRLGGSGRTWHNNFKLGAVATIRLRLDEERQMLADEARMDAEMSGGSSALVRTSLALVRMTEESGLAEAKAKRGNRITQAAAGRVAGNESAYSAGKRAGHNVSLSGRPATGGALGAG